MKKCLKLYLKYLQYVIIPFLIGCSNLNNERNDEKIISTKIAEISQNNVELTNFDKVSEQEINWFGNIITIVEFDGIINYKKSGNTVELSLDPYANEKINFLNLKLDIGEDEKKYYPDSIKKNDVKNIHGKIVYEKDANGLNLQPDIYMNLK